MRTGGIKVQASGLALRPIDPFYPLQASRLSPEASAFARLSLLAAAAALISTFVVTGSSLEPSPALAATPPQELAGEHGGKDQTRAPAMLRFEASRFERHVPSVGNDLAVRLKPVAAAGGEWQEKEFPVVSVVDGRTLDAGGLKIRLAGIALPREDAVCRTLDGRLETCLSRAATTLDVHTRWRRVSCRYQLQGFDQAVGTCRAGGVDLAERMLRAGYARHEGSEAGGR